MKLLNKFINYGLFLFIILLPWQTRLIYKDASLGGSVFEYGRLSLYASEIVLFLVLIAGLAGILCKYIKNPDLRFKNFKDELKGAWLWIILLAVWSAVTIIWSADNLIAWYGWLKLVEGIGLFWLVSQRNTDGSRMAHGWLTDSLIISGLIQAGFGILQFFNQTAIQANKWLGLAKIDHWESGPSVIEFLDQRWLRAYGSLPHPNILGGFLAICLIVLIINMFKLHSRLLASQTVSKKDLYLNIFYWLSLVITFFGLIVTFSRSAWLGFAIVFVFLALRSFIKKLKVARTVIIKISTVFMAVSVLFLVSFPYQLITTRIKSETRLEKISLFQRQTAYQQSAKIIRANWYKGVGPGNYLVVVNQIQPELERNQLQPVHDTSLLTLAELGIIGLALYILVIVLILKNRSRYWPIIICLLIIGLFDHYFRSLYFGLMLWWLVMALAYKEKLID